ncbi:hypothetical protein DFP72DRAFT_1019195 [Ephemerocybe angulata]|uniref:Uncharacterized protein n=1 Tax=Ephemerocybe angulata TaxID=980116 RepID=A0A8H6HDJ7_9AGAR|nr:hypothetical protein DFP72DRAFT_1019195 [Tulosesus angulatus]
MYDAPAYPVGTKTTRQFFAYLEDAMDSRFPPDGETTVIDFAVFLLGMLDYDDGDGRRLLHTRKEMPFYMEDGRVDVKADATVIERKTSRFYQYILLVHENKFTSGVDPEAQLIAQAIGAFQRNNRIRKRAKISELKSQIFPAITMFGTAVTFYKITITEELAMAVESDIFPAETIVHAFVPPLPRYISQGMGPLGNRRFVLRCFEAFKQFMAGWLLPYHAVAQEFLAGRPPTKWVDFYHTSYVQIASSFAKTGVRPTQELDVWIQSEVPRRCQSSRKSRERPWPVTTS